MQNLPNAHGKKITKVYRYLTIYTHKQETNATNKVSKLTLNKKLRTHRLRVQGWFQYVLLYTASRREGTHTSLDACTGLKSNFQSTMCSLHLHGNHAYGFLP